MGVKPDEIALMESFRAEANGSAGQLWKVAERLGIPFKRAVYIAEKWANKDWIEYGGNALGGWLTDLGWKAELH